MVRRHSLACIVLLSALAVAVFVFDDYGMGWDETSQRMTGLVNANYIAGRSDDLLSYPDRDYGPLFELPLVLFELFDETRDTIHARHLASHLFFLGCVGAFYALLVQHYQNRWLAFAGMLMLLLSPRIYAHSFFNSKDVPALGFWILALLTLRLVLRFPDLRGVWLLHAVMSAFLINIRLTGAIMPCVTGLAWAWFFMQRTLPRQQLISRGLLYGCSSAFILYLTWPYLWNAPLEHFWGAVEAMTSFRWEGSVFFLGRLLRADELPWYYLPVWIFFTVPMLYLLLTLTGILGWLVAQARAPLERLKSEERVFELLVLICLVSPLLLVSLLNPILYNGWRHFYFVYPAVLFFAVWSLRGIWAWSSSRSACLQPIVAATVTIALALVGTSMVRAHPHQQAYFNVAASWTDPPVWEQMDGDYWAVSYLQALEFIVAQDSRERIRVTGTYRPLRLIRQQRDMLPRAERSRILPVDRGEAADYLLTTGRGIDGADQQFFPPGPLVYEVILGDFSMLRVYAVENVSSLENLRLGY